MKKVLFTFLITSSIFSMAQTKIKWLSVEQATKLNEKEPRKIIMDVYTDWCGWCKRMDASTFSNPVIADYINKNFYAIKFNAESKDSIKVGNQLFINEQPNNKRYPHQLAIALMGGKMSYPTIVYLDENLKKLQAVPGYQTPESLEPIIHFFATNEYKTTPWGDYQKNFKSELKQAKAKE